MDSTIYWERLQPAIMINHAYDDKAINALAAYFGEFPIILTEEHLPILRSWRAIGGGRPLDELIAAVEKNKEIRVWWDGPDWRGVKERERRIVLDRTRPSLQPKLKVERG